MPFENLGHDWGGNIEEVGRQVRFSCGKLENARRGVGEYRGVTPLESSLVFAQGSMGVSGQTAVYILLDDSIGIANAVRHLAGNGTRLACGNDLTKIAWLVARADCTRSYPIGGRARDGVNRMRIGCPRAPAPK